MAFPTSPVNGQTAVINNINYAFSSANNAWKRLQAPSGAGTITYNPIQVATAGQTVFSVPSGYSGNLIMVYVNGYKLPPADYAAVNGTSITLNVGSNVNDEVETVVFGGQTLAASSTLQRTSFIATSLQTTFAVTYAIGMILVKVNGLIVPTSDYTANNGTSVIFALGVPTGTEIEFLVFSAMNLVNAVPSTGGTMTGALAVGADVTMASQNGGQLAGMRNVIINGDMRVNLRGTGGTVNSNYMIDRWLGFSGGSQPAWSWVGTGQAYPIGTAAIQITGVVGNAGVNITQRVESSNSKHLAGQQATLSYWVYQTTGAAITITPTISYATSGDNFTGTSSVGVISPVGISVPNAVWTKIISVFTLPSAATTGLAVTAFNNTLLASQTVQITNVQLEPGTIATPFEQRPVGLEVMLCQRYYEASTGGEHIFSGNVSVGGNYYGMVKFAVQKRTSPTMVWADAGNSMFAAGNPVNAGTINASGAQCYKVGNATGAGYFAFGFTASAEL